MSSSIPAALAARMKAPDRLHRSRRLIAALSPMVVTATFLVVIGPAATPAFAAAEDRVTGSWNMHGEMDGGPGVPESRWRTGVQQMLNTDGVQVAALQEAGNAPPRSSTWTHRVFPNHTGVTEHRWNIGTHHRPHTVNIYWVDTGQQRNGLAILSRDRAQNAVQLAVNSRFNSRPMLGVQFGTDWYFTAHARANGEHHANDAEDIIETARQFMANRPGEDWMVIADFNNNPGRMPLRLQNHIIAADAPTHEGGGELDFAYTNTGNNNTVNAGRRGLGSDHFFMRYAVNPNCGGSGGPSARVEWECNAPVPGEVYRFFARHLDNAVISIDTDTSGPFLKRATGSKENEAILVGFSTVPGQYLLVINFDLRKKDTEGWCLARYRGPIDSVTAAPCGSDLPDFDGIRWKFHKGQIVTPHLGRALQPRPHKMGALVVLDTHFYQWRPEPFDTPKGQRSKTPTTLNLNSSK